MVVGLRILVSARLLVSAADLYGGAGLRERASACFLARVGDYELSQHLAHHRLHLRHGSERESLKSSFSRSASQKIKICGCSSLRGLRIEERE
eukprot:COSAG02_NODE_3678_length_6391_cov_3.177845_9_plen_92_part_01